MAPQCSEGLFPWEWGRWYPPQPPPGAMPTAPYSMAWQNRELLQPSTLPRALPRQHDLLQRVNPDPAAGLLSNAVATKSSLLQPAQGTRACPPFSPVQRAPRSEQGAGWSDPGRQPLSQSPELPPCPAVALNCPSPGSDLCLLALGVC
ncbi:unnamed protein product [Lepidochelys kempii]